MLNDDAIMNPLQIEMCVCDYNILDLFWVLS